MEAVFLANPFAMAAIAVAYLVFVVLNFKRPYDRQTQSRITALRQHVEEREKYALEGVELRRAQRKAEKRAR
ncbi:hypothetical protein os1_24790 [Comamonadaceae bacterium OS-1]|nr:hypothetical protein os1_24790 [Comamonadaceae bacterium OS-1]